MAAKKTIAPTPVPTRTSGGSKTVKQDNTVTATRTDADTTHEKDPGDAGVHDDTVDSVLAGIATSRNDALIRATGGQSSPDDDPTGGRGKAGKSSLEETSDAGPDDGGQTTTTRLPAGGVVQTDKDEGVRSKGHAVKDDGSEITRIGNLIGTGGPSGPTRDALQQALAEQDAAGSPGTAVDSKGNKVTQTPSGGTKTVSPDGTVTISAGNIRSERKADGTVTVVNAVTNTQTRVNPDGSTETRNATTDAVIDTTPKLQDAAPAQGPPGSSEQESPDDDGPGEPADSAPADPDDDGQSVDPGNDGQTVDPTLDPEGQSLVPEDEVTGGADDPDGDPDGQSIDPELDPEGQSVDPTLDPEGQSVEPDPDPGTSADPADDPNGQSTEPEPEPEDDPNGQSTEPEDDPNGQSTEPEPAPEDDDGQSSDAEQSVSQTGDPGGGDPGDPDGGGATLPPDISQAIKSDIARLRGAKPATGDGATDPGPEDTGDEVDRSVAVVPDKFNQLLGGDNFNRDGDNVHTGNANVPSGPQTGSGFTDPGPDDDQPAQFSGPEQDPFDQGPQLKPIESRTTTSDDTDDDDDDDGATIGSPLFASTAVRQFQFDHVPTIADDDPDDD